MKTTALVQEMLSVDVDNPSYINALPSKTVTQLLPKWNAGENVRNYTKRIQHAWDYVKDDFEENKFMNLVRISVSANLGEIIDNFMAENEAEASRQTVKNLCEALNTKLDKRPSEYITEFISATKVPSESYSAYAHRLKELYKKGTESKGVMNSGERRLLVEQFFEGLPYSESATLKMVANDEEMMDVDKLALRAARSGKSRTPIALISDEADKEGQTESDE